jgi:hypothetical protein
MNNRQLTLLQEVYFDICDLINSREIDDICINGFEEFETVLEFLEEQKLKLSLIEDYRKQA